MIIDYDIYVGYWLYVLKIDVFLTKQKQFSLFLINWMFWHLFRSWWVLNFQIIFLHLLKWLYGLSPFLSFVCMMHICMYDVCNIYAYLYECEHHRVDCIDARGSLVCWCLPSFYLVWDEVSLLLFCHCLHRLAGCPASILPVLSNARITNSQFYKGSQDLSSRTNPYLYASVLTNGSVSPAPFLI